MEALVVLGTLGSGKTTTNVRLLEQVASEELHKVHLIVNEVGAYSIDVSRIRQAHQQRSRLDITDIPDGCMSCKNLSELSKALERLAALPEGRLLVDPSGIADGHELKAPFTDYGMQWHCLTLVNPGTFQDDMRVGILPSQLEVATVIGITRPETLSETERDQLLQALAPYGVPVIDIALESMPTIETLLAYGNAHHHDEDCDCGHDHHDHDDHHHGDYASTPVRLRSDVTIETLREACEQLKIRRAKGVVEGRWFDCVGGTFTVGETRGGKPYAIFIDRNRLPAEVIVRLSVERPSAKTLVERFGDLSESEADTQVARLLAQVGDTAVNDESLELALLLAEECGLPEVRAQTIRFYVERTLGFYDVLIVRRRIHGRPVASDDMMHGGAGLIWYAMHNPLELGTQLLAAVRARRPAAMWLHGLEHVARTKLLRYDLFPPEYDGPLCPELAGELIPEWCKTYEGMWMIDEAIEVFGQLAEASKPYPEWSERWWEAARRVPR